MIQIRKKKEQQRQTIRRDYLDNHFKEMRRKCFNLENNTPINSQTIDFQPTVFQILLTQSQKFNCLADKLRNQNLFSQLEKLVSSAVTGMLDSCKLSEIKFLLTIISNTLCDELEVDEKIALFKLSDVMFDKLNLSGFNKNNQQETKFFQSIVKQIRPEVLSFYMFIVNSISACLDEENQIRIQTKIYPALLNLLMYNFNQNPETDDLQEFNKDVQKFFFYIFNLEDEPQQMGNSMKAERLLPFYSQILHEHLWQLENNNEFFLKMFTPIEVAFFKSYQRIMEVLADPPDIFCNPIIFKICERTFEKEPDENTQIQMKCVYSILSKFIDKNMFMNQIEHLLLIPFKDVTGFERVIHSVMQNTAAKYRATELIEVVLIVYFNQKKFSRIIERFKIALVDVNVQILRRFDETEMGSYRKRSMIYRAVTVLYVLIEIQRIEQTQDKNILRRIENESGKKALENISAWFHDIESGDDMELNQIMEKVDQIIQQVDLEV